MIHTDTHNQHSGADIEAKVARIEKGEILLNMKSGYRVAYIRDGKFTIAETVKHGKKRTATRDEVVEFLTTESKK